MEQDIAYLKTKCQPRSIAHSFLYSYENAMTGLEITNALEQRVQLKKKNN